MIYHCVGRLIHPCVAIKYHLFLCICITQYVLCVGVIVIMSISCDMTLCVWAVADLSHNKVSCVCILKLHVP